MNLIPDDNDIRFIESLRLKFPDAALMATIQVFKLSNNSIGFSSGTHIAATMTDEEAKKVKEAFEAALTCFSPDEMQKVRDLKASKIGEKTNEID
jgi:hypothetical protein